MFILHTFMWVWNWAEVIYGVKRLFKVDRKVVDQKRLHIAQQLLI